ncbi:MAG: ribonuclease H-like domain-containing protein [Thermoflexales bacterium]|nr:ribonuclease H-like domain-containing protein [Thermoflexales bacterium]
MPTDLSPDLRERLRRLGVVRGARLLPPSPRRPVAVESVLPGRFYETPAGRCWLARTEYPAGHAHGRLPLQSFLALSPDILSVIGGDPSLATVPLSQALFLDTETTGLSGGTGTMAFLVGLGFFEEDRFVVLQAFLRDPGDEPAMIGFLDEFLPRFRWLVTFNGQGFDVPILQNRFILARRPFPLDGVPHLDLLPPARRLWREHLVSCSLTALERDVLGVVRDQADIPSGVIPLVYRDYLRTGDAREIPRILYHNRIDIMSMPVLAAHLGRVFADPEGEAGLSGEELGALARWYREAGRDAEMLLRAALRRTLRGVRRARWLTELAQGAKRRGDWSRSVEWWQQLALEAPDRVEPAVELAKVYEWHLNRPALALGWAREALRRAEGLPPGPQREQEIAEIRHRLCRLERRIPPLLRGNK